VIDPSALQMVLAVLTGWLDCQERQAVAWAAASVHRSRSTPAGGRRHRLGRQVLRQIASVVTPDTLKEFVDHYHRERNHQGLQNRLSMGVRRGDARAGSIGVRGSAAC
jgi:hypothetical protein